ncbi:MAG: signal peptide peptidase SppA [Treponema sp.]|nr:signal peptide peptidase SppA [Treponema sp.]
MKKKFTSGLIVLFCVLLIVISMVVISVSANKNEGNNGVHYTDNPYGNPNGVTTAKNYNISNPNKGKEYIAAVYVEGTIEEENNLYNQKWLLSTISQLKNDNNNTAIALYIDSPGGGVYQADEVYLALQDYKTTGKKIYVYMGPLAASGGYYISCAADRIYANRNTLTGSIGVIMGQMFDITEFLDDLGIKVQTIASGKNKNLGNFNEPLTDEQKEIMQSICDECYEQFLSIVVKQRQIPSDKAKEIADGRIYTANQALNLGLIDSIDSWENMIRDLADLTIKDSECKVKVFNYERELTFFESMLKTYSDVKTKEAAENMGLPQVILEKINKNSSHIFNSYPAYLCENF